MCSIRGRRLVRRPLRPREEEGWRLSVCDSTSAGTVAAAGADPLDPAAEPSAGTSPFPRATCWSDPEPPPRLRDRRLRFLVRAVALPPAAAPSSCPSSAASAADMGPGCSSAPDSEETSTAASAAEEDPNSDSAAASSEVAAPDARVLRRRLRPLAGAAAVSSAAPSEPPSPGGPASAATPEASSSRAASFDAGTPSAGASPSAGGASALAAAVRGFRARDLRSAKGADGRPSLESDDGDDSLSPVEPGDWAAPAAMSPAAGCAGAGVSAAGLSSAALGLRVRRARTGLASAAGSPLPSAAGPGASATMVVWPDCSPPESSAALLLGAVRRLRGDFAPAVGGLASTASAG